MLLHGQSPDIGQGVDNAADRQGEEGAGDQGIMFGYACRETPDLMPAPIYYSHKILELLAAARHEDNGDAGLLGPDAKSQVTVRYVDGKAAEVTQIVLVHPASGRELGSQRRCAKLSNPTSAKRWAI